MAFAIDLDKGVHMRSHPGTGMDIYMYVNDPGVYLSAHGHVVSDELARQAGFPVDEEGKKRKIKLALQAAQDEVMKEFNQVEGPVTVEEKDGFKILDIGMGRHQVVSPDGDVLNPNPIPLEQAKVLLAHLAPSKEVSTDE